MKQKTVHEYHEGPEAAERLDAALSKILLISPDELERREKEYRRQQGLKPKRGPKRKVKPSAVVRESTGEV